MDGRSLDVFVPVSVRDENGRGDTGNEISGMVASLPIGHEDPRDCFADVSASMRTLKDSGQAVGAQALVGLTGFAPATILDQASRVAARQRFTNLVVTNVPGPQQPLYFGDNELLDIFPMVPLGGNLALGVAILSYNGTLTFGLVGDFDRMPDLEELGELFEDAIEEAAAAAGVSLDAGGSSPSSSASSSSSVGAPSSPPAATRSPGNGGASARVATGLLEPTEDPLVASSADEGAGESVGASVVVDEPWEAYGAMRAADIVDRLAAASAEEIAVVELYERAHKARRTVLEAAAQAMRRN